MLSYLIRKLGVIIPTFFGVTLVAFVFIRLLPGDPVLLMAGERGMTEERHARLMAEFGFDNNVSHIKKPAFAGLIFYSEDFLFAKAM